ncbi:uncharacterized protein LOC106963624 [Poecilia latipinna]|uniref:uncharacterized protein LOC106963624 n=1 Tax=Poecilia latipinna TaxID=48699 RepID=UPI00072E0CFE|nr:PREDICTED: uncharacterized protein LOC106963624 [Poecilia latipinna]XP_014914131.1 PREDICTED: uncharacterized protein LOC106963624 [Poecilia latipinna]
MSVNASSFFNSSLPNSNMSASVFSSSFYTLCLSSSPSSFIYTTFNVIRIFLTLPLCLFVLNLGLQQQKKSPSSSSGTMSHTDYFTYHLVTMELIDVLGYIFSFIGISSNDLYLIVCGVYVMFFVWYGQMSFHVLMCVERYLAVVHPIAYVGFRNERGIRIRNAVVGCVWLLCFIGMALISVRNMVFPGCMLIVSLTSVSFCSLSVLCVLIRPGPGEQAENRDRVDPSKQRAFYTISAILAALLLRITWGALYFVLYLRQGADDCVIIVSCVWFTIPSSLVLPLLFLHRAGELQCCKLQCLIEKLHF